MGMATEAPEIATILEDLLSIGEGLDIVQHRIAAGDAGPASGREGWGPVVAVVRGGELIHFDDARADDLHEGDRVIALRGHDGTT